MIVVAIIGILAAIAVPQFNSYRDRAFMAEGYELASPIRQDVVEYYSHRGLFPVDNKECGLPEPNNMIGNFVTGIEIENGVIRVHLANCVIRLASGKIRTIRPAVVKGEPVVPHCMGVWVCFCT